MITLLLNLASFHVVEDEVNCTCKRRCDWREGVTEDERYQVNLYWIVLATYKSLAASDSKVKGQVRKARWEKFATCMLFRNSSHLANGYLYPPACYLSYSFLQPTQLHILIPVAIGNECSYTAWNNSDGTNDRYINKSRCFWCPSPILSTWIIS